MYWLQCDDVSRTENLYIITPKDLKKRRRGKAETKKKQKDCETYFEHLVSTNGNTPLDMRNDVSVVKICSINQKSKVSGIYQFFSAQRNNS